MKEYLSSGTDNKLTGGMWAKPWGEKDSYFHVPELRLFFPSIMFRKSLLICPAAWILANVSYSQDENLWNNLD